MQHGVSRRWRRTGLLATALASSAGIVCFFMLATREVSSPEVMPAKPTGENGEQLPPRPGPRFEASSRAQDTNRQPVTQPVALTTVRGRCVDGSTGAYLPGCTVTLRGRMRSAAGSPPQGSAVTVTDDDGRFELGVELFGSVDHWLEINAAGRAPVGGPVTGLEAGSVADLGDISLWPAVPVTGLVVDTKGTPQPDVPLEFTSLMATGSGPRPARTLRTVTRPDGTFAIPVVMVGSWNVSARPKRLVEPRRIVIEPGSTAPLQVVVLGDDENPPITGTVVGVRGEPVAGARVRFGPSGSRGPMAVSGDDGTFTLGRRERDRLNQAVLSVDAPGYEVLTTEEVYSWGASGVVLVLHAGGVVEVQVLDGETDRPVERYAVRCYPDPIAAGRISDAERQLRLHGHHEDGLVLVPGIRRGLHRLVVGPGDPDHFESRVQTFGMTGAGAPRQVVRLPRRVRTTLVVTSRSGDPVPGSIVDLWRDTADRHVSLRRRFVPSNEALVGDSPVMLDEGETDARGRIVLAGPAGEALTLRLLGPGHEPKVLRDFVLEAGEIDVEVSTGATLHGRLIVSDATRGLWDELRSERQDPSGMRVTRRSGESRTIPVASSHAGIDEEGRFRIDGIPAGDWELRFTRAERSRGGIVTRRQFFVQAVDGLADGETRHVEVPLEALVKGSLRGTVFLNGQALGNAGVSVRGVHVDSRGVRHPLSSPGARTSGDGSFELALLPGTYSLHVSPAAAVDPDRTSLQVRETVVIDRGSTTDRVFHVDTGRVRLRALGSDGAGPVDGVPLELRTEDGRWRKRVETGADGAGEIRLVPAGKIIVAAFPAALATLEARRQHARETGVQPEPTALLTIDVQGQDGLNPVQIVLPASFGY